MHGFHHLYNNYSSGSWGKKVVGKLSRSVRDPEALTSCCGQMWSVRTSGLGDFSSLKGRGVRGAARVNSYSVDVRTRIHTD